MIREIAAKVDVIKLIEERLLRFDLFQAKYRQTLRREPKYKLTVRLLTPIINKVGIDKAEEIYKAVGTYTTSQYGRMNNDLRSGKEPKSTPLIDEYLRLAPHITLSKVYRGVSGNLFSKLRPGMKFVDRAFVSTTTDMETAAWFARRKAPKGGVLIITNVAGLGCQIPYEGEDEILLKRGLKFQVIEINKDTATLKVIK